MKNKNSLSWEFANSLLKYNEKTGSITWRKFKHISQKGKIAGGIYKNGYRCISIKTKRYYAHRIAWLLKFKVMPTCQIDHINGNRLDNRIENLRDISIRQNSSNQQRHRDGKLVGAHFDKHSRGPSKWKTRIQVNGKIIHVGSSKTEKEAHEKYLKFKNERKLK